MSAIPTPANDDEPKPESAVDHSGDSNETPVDPNPFGPDLAQLFANALGGEGGTRHIFILGGEGPDGASPEDLPPFLRQLLGIKSASQTKTAIQVPSVGKVMSYLDKRVVGQDEAKEVMSVAVHNHYRRAAWREKVARGEAADDGVRLEKSNVMLIGDTGTGKTHIVRSIAKMLDVPFVTFDATNLTGASYAGGDNVDTIIAKLVKEADGDVARAERGIIYIDEIDKLANRRDIYLSGGGGQGNLSSTIQQALLTLFEGTTVEVSPTGDRNMMPSFALPPNLRPVKVDTSNILFVCSGAFGGSPSLSDIIRERKGLKAKDNDRKSIVGFQTAAAPVADKAKANMLQDVQPVDLHRYGLMSEFVGRTPTIGTLEPLTLDALLRIMTEPENSIVKQYQTQFREDGAELDFEPDALRAIAEQALAYGEGARGLRAVLEKVLRKPTMTVSNADGSLDRIVITAETVRAGAPAIAIPKNAGLVV